MMSSLPREHIQPGESFSRRSPEPLADRAPWPLTVATYNIHSAVGRDARHAPERVAGVLDEIDADIVALQEVPLGGAGTVNVLDYLTRKTGLFGAEGLTMTTNGRRYGNAVLSRFPIQALRTLDLSFGGREPRSALDADVLCHGRLVRVVATHLGLKAAERRRQVQKLLQAFDTPDMPVILMGDLNEWFLWGRSLRWLVSHFERVPAPRTFPAFLPLFSLDRIWFHPAGLLTSVYAHASPLARMASDHLPLVARIEGL
jgi:endonuclease/exonuclease/phosphatase family metal-dependent hydrolase